MSLGVWGVMVIEPRSSVWRYFKIEPFLKTLSFSPATESEVGARLVLITVPACETGIVMEVPIGLPLCLCSPEISLESGCRQCQTGHTCNGKDPLCVSVGGVDADDYRQYNGYRNSQGPSLPSWIAYE